MKHLPKIFVGLLACLVLVTLAMAVPAQPGDVRGTVMSVNHDNLTFVLKREANGREITFGLDEDPAIYINEEIRSFEDLRAGDRVSIVGRQEENAWLATEIRCERK